MNKKHLVFTKEVIQKIRNTIGNKMPEAGGWLGSSDGIHIDHYYYDTTAKTSRGTYSPDTEAVSSILELWEEENISLIGCIHSHPHGMVTPSHEDFRYALKIIEAFNLDRFLMTILQVHPSMNGEKCKFYSYLLYGENRKYTLDEVEYESENVKPLEHFDGDIDEKDLYQQVMKNTYRYNDCLFNKTEDLIPHNEIKNKVIIVIGTGGSAGFIEDMVRYGFEKFILLDADRYVPANIATQKAYLADAGEHKVEALKKRLLNVNPNIKVKAVPRFLNEYMSDAEFYGLLDIEDYPNKMTDILICACTDSFNAQKRAAELSQSLGTAYIAPQIYAGGEGVEIFFSYPGVTKCCQRCALNSRYEAYENGYKNDVVSNNTPISTITMANAMEGHIALMLLLYHEGEGRYSKMLDIVAGRNLVLIKTSPYIRENLGIDIFDNVTNGNMSFFGDVIWVPCEPREECGICKKKGGDKEMSSTLINTKEDYKDD